MRQGIITRRGVYNGYYCEGGILPPDKAVDSQPPAHGTLSAELREYYVERRRALLTELKALDKLLGLSTTK